MRGGQREGKRKGKNPKHIHTNRDKNQLLLDLFLMSVAKVKDFTSLPDSDQLTVSTFCCPQSTIPNPTHARETMLCRELLQMVRLTLPLRHRGYYKSRTPGCVPWCAPGD